MLKLRPLVLLLGVHDLLYPEYGDPERFCYVQDSTRMFPVKSFPLDLRPDVLVGEIDSVLFRECHCASFLN